MSRQANTETEALKVGFPLYDGFDSLDVLGPFQTFTFADMDRYLLAETCDPVTSFEGVALQPRKTFCDCPQLDVLFVPGGADPVAVLQKGPLGNNAYLDFLAKQAPKCKLVCSVCTGSLLLAGAGLLDGYTATTHWVFRDVLRLFPCQVAEGYPRYVPSGNRITGAGISSGLDEALYIVSVLYGDDAARRGQLAMQYHPQPGFHCGDPSDSEIKEYPQLVPDLLAKWRPDLARKAVCDWLGPKCRAAG